MDTFTGSGLLGINQSVRQIMAIDIITWTDVMIRSSNDRGNNEMTISEASSSPLGLFVTINDQVCIPAALLRICSTNKYRRCTSQCYHSQALHA